MSSCLDPAPVQIPTIVTGEDKNVDVRLTNSISGDPFDLTSATEIDAIFLKNDGTCLHKKLSLSEIVILSALGGKFQIILTAADTEDLALSPDNGYSNIEIRITIASKITIVLLKNVIKVVPKLFPNC